VLGIDPGTRSFDLLGLEDGRVCFDETIPSAEIASNPRQLVDAIQRAGPCEVIVGPSGYGLPLTHINELTAEDASLMTLVRKDDAKIPVLVAVSQAVKELRQHRLNVYFIPGIIHLQTVPEHRKLNSIDMGTADKLCCAVLAVQDYANRYRVPYGEVSLVLVELGFGYNAVVGIDGGRVVDGIGGTKAGPGFLTLGAMDGELAYLLGSFSKKLLFSGGVRSIAGDETLEPEEFPNRAKQEGRTRLAWSAFMEGIEKNVAAMLSSVRDPKAILLSGRLSRVPEIAAELHSRLSHIAPVDRVVGLGAKAKEAAQGAALVADGLAGGKAKQLIEHMGIREARGTVLDYCVVADVKRKILGAL